MMSKTEKTSSVGQGLSGAAKRKGLQQVSGAAATEGAEVPPMTEAELEAIREKLGYTQMQMADFVQCDYVAYKRYATGSRPVPRYIARCALLLNFIRENGLQKKIEKMLK